MLEQHKLALTGLENTQHWAGREVAVNPRKVEEGRVNKIKTPHTKF